VYRQAGGRRKAVSGLIFRTAAPGGGAYRFVDRRARASSSARYLVEMIHPDGSRDWFGPVDVD
jgi:hypothetical protein